MTIDISLLFRAPSGVLGVLLQSDTTGQPVGPSRAMADFSAAQRDLEARGAVAAIPLEDALADSGLQTIMTRFERAVAKAADASSLARDPDVQKLLATIAGFAGPLAQDRSQMQRILTSDLSDPNSYARKIGANDPAALRMAELFDLHQTGLSEIQRFDRLAQARLDYANSIRNGAAGAPLATALPERLDEDPAFQRDMELFTRAISRATDLTALAKDADFQKILVQIAGLDSTTAKDRTLIQEVLLSDLSDPNSVARIESVEKPALLRMAAILDLSEASFGAISRPSRIDQIRKDYADAIVNARDAQFLADFDKFETAIMGATDLEALALNADAQKVLVAIAGLDAAKARDKTYVQDILLSDLSLSFSVARTEGLDDPAALALATLADFNERGLAGLQDPDLLASLRRDYAETLKKRALFDLRPELRRVRDRRPRRDKRGGFRRGSASSRLCWPATHVSTVTGAL